MLSSEEQAKPLKPPPGFNPLNTSSTVTEPSLNQVTGYDNTLPTSSRPVTHPSLTLSQLAGLSAASQSSVQCSKDMLPRGSSSGLGLMDLAGSSTASPFAPLQTSSHLIACSAKPSLSQLAATSDASASVGLSKMSGSSRTQSTGPSLASLAGLSTLSTVASGPGVGLTHLKTPTTTAFGPSRATTAGLSTSTSGSSLSDLAGLSAVSTGTSEPKPHVSSLAGISTQSSGTSQPTLASLAGLSALSTVLVAGGNRKNEKQELISPFSSSQVTLSHLAEVSRQSEGSDISTSGSRTAQPTLSDLARMHTLSLDQDTQTSYTSKDSMMQEPISLGALAALNSDLKGVSYGLTSLQSKKVTTTAHNSVQFQKQSLEELRKPHYFAMVLSGSLRKGRKRRATLERDLAGFRAKVLKKMGRKFVARRTRFFDFSLPSPDDVVREKQKGAGFGTK